MNELDILTKPQVCEPDKFLDELNEDANYMYEAKYDPKELEKRMCEVWDKWHKPMPELDQVRDLLFESKKNQDEKMFPLRKKYAIDLQKL